uniref:Variant surface glycoprotein 1125.5469 n=1 Tax=Trypanosoma brucei TaxID=5691 RepID=A0A1J0RCF1_9TRYP|nr:variant surface glycoprotein 1125.5469 [Trypanosoma brucei]
MADAKTSNNTRKLVITTMSIRTGVEVTNTISKVQEAESKYLTAIGLLKALVARLRTLHKLKPTKIALSATTKGQGATQYTATGLYTCSSTVTPTAEADSNCSLESDQAGQITDANVNLQTAGHLNILPDDKIQLTKFKLIAAAKASDSVTDPAASHQGICTESGNKGNPSAASNVIAGVLEVTDHDAAPEKTQIFAANDVSKCNPANRDATWRADAAPNLAQTLCELKKVDSIVGRRYHKENAAQFVGDSELMTILFELNSPGTKAPETEQEKKALIEKFFPQDPTAFKTEITDAIEKTEI